MKTIVITLLNITASSLLANAQIGATFKPSSDKPVETPPVNVVDTKKEVKTPVKKEVLMKYFRMNGTYKIYEDVFKNLMDLLKKEYTGKPVSSKAWKSLAVQKDKVINDIINQVASVYKKNISNEDLTALMGLYESLDYENMMNDKEVFEAEKKSFFDFYNSEKGKAVSYKLIDVSNEVSAVNEDWSSNLYMDFKEILDASL